MRRQERWIKKKCRYPRADRHRMQQKILSIRAGRKARRAEKVGKKVFISRRSNHRRHQNRIRLIGQAHDHHGAEITTCIVMMKQGALHRQDYLVCQVVCLVVVKQGIKDHRRGLSDILISSTRMHSNIAPTAWWITYRNTTAMSQETSDSGR